MASKIVKDSVIYGLSAVLNRSLGLLLIPLYTRHLDVSEYGALSILNRIMQNVSLLCLLGVGTASLRFYYDQGATADSRKRVYGNAISLLLVGPAIVLAILGPPAWLAMSSLMPSIPFFPLVFAVMLTGLATPMTKLMSGLLRARRCPTQFLAFHLSFFVVQTLTIILAVAVLGYGLEGQIYSQLLVTSIFGAISLIVLVRYSRARVDWVEQRRLLAYGLPLIPFFLFAWLFDSAGRFLLEHFDGLAAVGLFALAAQVSGILVVASSTLDTAMLPHFLERASETDGPAALGTLTCKLTAGLGVIAIGIAGAGAPLIAFVAGDRFQAAARYIPPLVMAAWLQASRIPVVWTLNYAKRPATLSRLAIASTTLLLCCLVIALGAFDLGIHGVAWSLAATNAIMCVVGYAVAHRYYQLALPRFRLFLVAVGTLGALGAVHILQRVESPVTRYVLQIACFFAVTGYLFRVAGIGSPLHLLRREVPGRDT